MICGIKVIIMTSKLVEKNDNYYCSNCMMRQPRVRVNCWWCGDLFSNYEEVLIKEINIHARLLIDKEELEDESDFY